MEEDNLDTPREHTSRDEQSCHKIYKIKVAEKQQVCEPLVYKFVTTQHETVEYVVEEECDKGYGKDEFLLDDYEFNRTFSTAVDSGSEDEEEDEDMIVEFYTF